MVLGVSVRKMSKAVPVDVTMAHSGSKEEKHSFVIEIWTPDRSGCSSVGIPALCCCIDLRCEVEMALAAQTGVSRGVAPCDFVDVWQRFGRTCCLNLQDQSHHKRYIKNEKIWPCSEPHQMGSDKWEMRRRCLRSQVTGHRSQVVECRLRRKWPSYRWNEPTSLYVVVLYILRINTLSWTSLNIFPQVLSFA